MPKKTNESDEINNDEVLQKIRNLEQKLDDLKEILTEKNDK